MKLNHVLLFLCSNSRNQPFFTYHLKQLINWLHTLLILTLFIGLTGCADFSPAIPPAKQPSEELVEVISKSSIPQSEITFRVATPENTPPDQPIYINILDEVTGLAINTQTHPMNMEDESHYTITLPFSLGSIVKYRYSRQGEAAPIEEHISDGRQLRYRLFHIEGPGEVQDVVTRWTDTQFVGKTGRITGKAFDALTGQPIPNILIVAGGAQALTTSDGSYLLEGLPPGTHNLVAYALDGSYRIFQQGALVAIDSTTPAELRLTPAKLVNVTFELTIPEDTIPAVPIRLAGNLYQLGNTFADLSGGVSTLASRMPILNPLPGRQYQLSLFLPVGADVRYLYTLGDSLWNAERNPDGEIRLRQIIVPDQDITISDSVDTWESSDSSPITFDVSVPEITPPDDYVSIQFRPFYGWTESIPMWSLGNNRWAFVLNTPTNLVNGLNYRYCRNDQCGSADDTQTMGAGSNGLPVSSEASPLTIVDQVESWAWLDSVPPLSEPQAEIWPRGPEYFAGIELQAGYHPSWTPLASHTLEDVQKTGANWLVLSPTWSFTRDNPPILEQVTGRDALWFDLAESIQLAQATGFNVALKPAPQFPTKIEDWWTEAPRDYSWWLVWFERYRNFALHHADLAARNNAQTLILGGEWLSPALPGGTLSDGTSSGVPTDADTRWRTIIQDIRSRYNGTIAWDLSYSQAVENPPPFLEGVDQIYLQFSPSLSNQLNPTQADLEAEAARLLDNAIFPLQTQVNKPLVLSVSYPSADGSNTACLTDPDNEGCLEFSALSRPSPDIPSITIDLEEQADIYKALLNIANTRQWITGFVSRGYYPPATLQDKSISIHGKPAEEVIKYWFPALLGEVIQ